MSEAEGCTELQSAELTEFHAHKHRSPSLIHHQPRGTFAISLQTLKQLPNLHLFNAKCSFLPLGISATQNTHPKEKDSMDGSPTRS